MDKKKVKHQIMFANTSVMVVAVKVIMTEREKTTKFGKHNEITELLYMSILETLLTLTKNGK